MKDDILIQLNYVACWASMKKYKNHCHVCFRTIFDTEHWTHNTFECSISKIWTSHWTIKFEKLTNQYILSMQFFWIYVKISTISNISPKGRKRNLFFEHLIFPLCTNQHLITQQKCIDYCKALKIPFSTNH